MRCSCVSVSFVASAFLLFGAGYARAQHNEISHPIQVPWELEDISEPLPGNSMPGPRPIASRSRRPDPIPSMDWIAESSPYGVLVLSRDATVLFANKLAHGALASRDGIEEVGGVFRLQRASLQRRLLDHLGELSSGALAPGQNRLIGVPNRSGRTRFVVKLAANGSEPGPAVLATIADLDAVEPADQRSLTNVFGLSQREGEFAAHFAAGMAVDDISAEMKISCGTARIHLRNVLMKIGCSSKSELARKLARANC